MRGTSTAAGMSYRGPSRGRCPVSGLSAAILGGAGAMLGWGTSDFFAKKTIDEIGDLATLFWGQLIGVAALGIGVLAADATVSYSGGAWLALVGLGIVSGGSYLVLYRGFGKGQVSVLSPIFASYAGVTALLAAFTLHEPLPLLAKVALGVIFVGILMMTTDVRDIRGSVGSARAIAGVPEVVCAMLIFSGWLVLWDRFLRHRDWLPGTAVMRSVAVLALLAFAAVSSQSLKVSRR